MKNHTKIYFNALGLHPTDFVCSEISGQKANDIHHLECKGMGGNPSADKDRIENLQALTREEHLYYGDKTEHMAYLFQKHYDFLDANGAKFDRRYLEDKISQYSFIHAVDKV